MSDYNCTSILYNYNSLAQNYNSFINIFYDFFADPIPENLTFQYTDPNNGPETANVPNLLQIQNNILSNLSESIIETSISTLQTLVNDTNATLFYEMNQLNNVIINTSTELLDDINSNTVLINNINFNLENNYYNIDQINTTFFQSSGGIISGDVTIQGNFQVNGTSYVLDSTTMDIGNSFIILNSSAIIPGLNAGIEVNRGNSTSVYLIWNEVLETWQLSDINGNYWDIVTEFSNTSLYQLVLSSNPVTPMQTATKEYVDNSYTILNSDILTNTILIDNTSSILQTEIYNVNTNLSSLNTSLTNLVYNTSSVLQSEINSIIMSNSNSSLTNLIYNTSSVLQSEINNVNSSLTNLVYNTSSVLQSEIDNIIISNSNSSLTNLIYNTSVNLQSEINNLNTNLLNSSSILQSEIVINNSLIGNLNSNLANNYYSINQANETFLPFSGGGIISGNVTIQGNFQVNGTSYVLDSTTMDVGDSFIVLNSSALEPGLNAGIEVNRGNGTSVYLIWNEVLETWQLSDINGNYWNIVTEFSNTSLAQLVLSSNPVTPMQTATKEYVDNTSATLQTEINNTNTTLANLNTSLTDLVYNTSATLQTEINDIIIANTSSSITNLIYNTSSILQNEIYNCSTNLSSLNTSLTSLVYNTSTILQTEINNITILNTSLTDLIYNTSSILQSEIDNANTSLANINTTLTSMINNTSSTLQTEINNTNTSLTNLINNTSSTLQSEINSINTSLVNTNTSLANINTTLTSMINNTSSTLQTEINSINTTLSEDYYTIPQINSTFLSLSGGTINGNLTITNSTVNNSFYAQNYHNLPYDISFYVNGTVPLIMYTFVSSRNLGFPSNLTSSFGIAGVGATANTTYNISINNSTVVADVIFLANSTTATFSSTGFAISPGQNLIFANTNTTADATLANIAITLTGTIT